MPVPPQLGYFQLQEEIGRGGMGSVWRAKDPTLNREVAIKVLRDEIAKDPKFVADFLQEARNAAAISHPHIAQVYLVGDAGGQYYIVMELLRGRSFRDVLETSGPLDEERALDIAIDVVEALRAAYKQQMIHGDIKPANIFITEEQGAKVLDFGLAKMANVEAPTAENSVWGSPYYISPERVGQRAEDFRSDVYSLGATLFHALTGRPPFDAEDANELALKRLTEKPPLLRDLNPKITPKTEQVVNKMLNKSVLMRYLDYDALMEDLREAKTEATAKRLGIDLHALEHPQPPIPAAKPPTPLIQSPMPILIGVSVAVIAIAAAVGIVLWQNHRLMIESQVQYVSPKPVQPKPVQPKPVPPKPVPPKPVPPKPVPPKPVKQQPVGPAIAACWLLDGRGDDVSGNWHTLSFVGSPTFAQGHSGRALLLNGIDQYAQTEEKVLDTSEPFSVTAWVTWTGGSSDSPVFISQDAPGFSAFYLGKHKTTGFTFALKRALEVSEAESHITLLPDTWYHVAGVFTGDEIKLYVNGTLAATNSIPTTYFAPGPMIVGAGLSNDKRSDYWGGLIDEVKAFSRAISDTEIAAMAAIPLAVVKNLTPSTVITNTATKNTMAAAVNTNMTPSGTSAKMLRSSADEAKLALAVVASLPSLWLAFDFQEAFTNCNNLDQQLTTPEGKRAIHTPLVIAKSLADFKTELIADFQRQPYNGASLVNHNNAPLSGLVTSATDEDLIIGTLYGETRISWTDVQPESLAKAGEFYADPARSSDSTEKQAKRHFQLMVFCKQFNLDCLSRKHSVEANRLDPSLNEETKLIWGNIPTPCSPAKLLKSSTLTAPHPSKPKNPKGS